MVDVYVNGKLITTQPFYIGKKPFAAGQGQQVNFTGADSLVLYTLSPGGVSEYADVKLCGKDKCLGYDNLDNSGVINIHNSCTKMLIATLIIYVSLLNIDSLDTSSPAKEDSDVRARANKATS